MSTTHADSLHTHANQDSRSEDPTETKTLRRKQTQNLNSRWSTVRGILRTTLEENDALRLRDTDYGPETSNIPGTLGAQAIDDFGAESNADRLSRFSTWFRNVLETHVLEPLSEDQVKEGRHFSSSAVARGYARGLSLANKDLRRSSLPDPDTGAEGEENPSDLIGRARHQDALKQARLQLYGDVERAVNETHTQASRELAETLGYAVVGGITIRALANAVIGRVSAIGQTRTETSIHTRVVGAVNTALINRGVETGVEEVGIEPEYETDGGVDEDVDDGEEPEYDFTTADGLKVCEKCIRHKGTSWTLTEILTGVAPSIPRHPRCRCRWRLS